jgi:AAA domain
MTAQWPYARNARNYRDLGWPNPIPVKGKHPPIEGFTGRGGADVTEQDVTGWSAAPPRRGYTNIALRLQDGVIGIDVDAYDGRTGDQTIAKAEADLGTLPATWSTTSRGPGQPARILLYRTPTGLDWSSSEGNAGKHVNVIYRGYRYVMVAGSIHPETRKDYRWYGPAGVVSGMAPKPGDLAELPEAWVAMLTAPGRPPREDPSGDRQHERADQDGVIPVGDRRSTLIAYAGRLRQRGLTHREALTLFRLRWLDCEQPPDDPAPWERYRAMLEDAYERYPAGPWRQEPPPVEQPPDEEWQPPDDGWAPEDEPEQPQPPAAVEELLPVQQAGTKPDRPRPETLIDNLAQQGELLVLGAARGIGKSWWGMDLAHQLARGHGRFMGAYTIRRAASVLYCHAEIDDWAAYDRWERLCGDQATPEGLVESFEPWRIRIVRRRVTSTGDGVSTSTEQVEAMLDPRLERTIIEHQVQVLVIDPWIGFYAGRENANDEAEMALATLRRLQLAYGLTVVILHHFGKGDTARDPEDLWRGASRLADWASTRVTLLPFYTPTQAKEMGMSRLQARQYATVKTLRRNHASPGEIAIKWNTDTGTWDRWRAPDGEGDPTGPTPADVAAKCPTPDGWPSMLAASVALGISRDKTRTVLEQARQQGLLETFEGARRAIGWRVAHATPDGSGIVTTVDGHRQMGLRGVAATATKGGTDVH